MGQPTAWITGGAGFIGSRLSHRLVAHGYRTVVADVLHPQVHAGDGWPAALAEGTERYPVDITSGAQCDALIRLAKPDVIVHLAAETGTGQSLTEASRHGMVNVVGTTTLLDALTRAGHVPDHFVLASSRAVYGEGEWQTPDGQRFPASPRTAEQLAANQWDPVPPTGPGDVTPCPHDAATTTPRPSNVYAATKLAQEHLLQAWTSAMGARLSILRLQNVYGPGQSLTNSYTGILNIFAQRALQREPIDVYEDGAIIRDFVFISDVVDGLLLATQRKDPEPLLVDIGSGRPVTLLEVAEVMSELTGAPKPIVSGKYRLGDVRGAFASLDGAVTGLGYAPAVDVRTGVGELLNWIRS